MRFPRLACLGVLPLLAAACTSAAHVATTTPGTGGAGGAVGATSSSATTTTTVTTGAGGGGGGGGSAPDIGQPSTTYPAPHAGAPSVQDLGGPVLASPKIVPIFFEDDLPSMVAQITDFENKIGGSHYWAAAATEYGVGAAVALPAISVMEIIPNTIDDSTIQAWLGGKLNGDDPSFPPADGNTIYVLHYPAGTTITSNGGNSCESFGGYHSAITLDANHGLQDVAYAVIPRCGNFDDFIGIDSVTGPVSHELMEAVTDPYPSITPTYALIDDQHLYWEPFLGGGEVGDMCAFTPGSFTKFPELSPYLVQRTWSNAAAAAGHDPCVPAIANTVYFNAAPVLNDNVSVSALGETITVKGVKIPVGKSKTIDVQLFSDGDTGGPWMVEADDASGMPGNPSNLGLVLDAPSGQNGQTLHLTITVMTAGQHKAEVFYLQSTLGQQQYRWYGVVGN